VGDVVPEMGDVHSLIDSYEVDVVVLRYVHMVELASVHAFTRSTGTDKSGITKATLTEAVGFTKSDTVVGMGMRLL